MILETYLKTATKGLYGSKKLEVQTEIEGNIRELAIEYQIAGLTQTQAISQAILDFGEARDLNAGMVKVHTMPKMIKAVLLTGLLSSVALVGVSSSLAEILTSSVGLYPNCTTEILGVNQFCIQRKAWMKLSDFTADISKVGGIFKYHTVNSKILSFTVTFPEDHAINIAYIRLPDSIADFKLKASRDAFFEKNNEIWVDLSYTLEQIARHSFLDVSIEGWENPRLHVGKTTLHLATGADATAAYYAYAQSVLYEVVRQDTSEKLTTFVFNPPVSDSEISSIKKFKHQILVNDKPGSVYALITFDQDNLTYISVAEVQANKTMTIWIEPYEVNFVDSLEKLDWHLKTVQSPAVLIKLNGRLDTQGPKLEVVVPAVTKSVAKF